MLVYDWLWWGQLTNQNRARRCAEVHRGVCGGARRCMEGCAEGCRGALKGAWRCAEVRRGVHRGAQRCTEGCAEVHRGKDFMLIRFLNAGI